MDFVSKIGSWLREPVKAGDVEWDWAAFNRSFGRTVGGHNSSFDEKSRPSPPDTSLPLVGEPTNTPRWAVLLGVTLGLGISVGFVVMIIWLGR
jgi:hypothetical protein